MFQKGETQLEENVANLINYFQWAEVAKHKTCAQTRILFQKSETEMNLWKLLTCV